MKRFLMLLSLAVLGISSLAQTQYPITLKHDLGETSIAARPSRVLALDEYALDLLLSIGVQPVGVALRGNSIVAGANLETIANGYFKNYLRQTPVSLGLRSRPSAEIILSLKPDLLVGWLAYNRSLYDQASQIAPTLLFDGNNKGAWRKALPVLAKALDREVRLKSAVQVYDQTISSAKKKLEPFTKTKPRVLLLTNYLDDYIAIGNNNSFPGQILEELGFGLVAPEGTEFSAFGIADTSLEAIAKLEPDVILTSTGIAGDLAVTTKEFMRSKHWDNNPILKNLKATRNNKVFFFNAFDFNALNGPIGLGILAQTIARTVR